MTLVERHPGSWFDIDVYVVQVCVPQSKEQCETKYEEDCKVTYASGKQCQKVPKKECKYVQVHFKQLNVFS